MMFLKPQQYKIADLNVRMTLTGDRTLQQAEVYRESFDAEPQIVIDIPPGRLETMHAENPHLTLADCEYIESGSVFYSGLIDFDGLMIHASAVAREGWAYLFSGPCGIGKSTHTRLWIQEFGDTATILNDDKPALRRDEGKFYVFGTPWSGKSKKNVNRRAKLAGIALVEQAEQNRIEREDSPEAVWFLLNQTIRPVNPARMEKVLDLLNDLLNVVPIWRFGCRPDTAAARLSYGMMKGERPQ